MADRREPIGALWQKTSSESGTTYFTGEIVVCEMEISVILLPDKIDVDGRPDYLVYHRRPRGKEERP